jgi:hypothetical protein
MRSRPPPPCHPTIIEPIPRSNYDLVRTYLVLLSALRIRIRIRIHRIHLFLGLLDSDPDLLVIGMDPYPSINKQK